MDRMRVETTSSTFELEQDRFCELLARIGRLEESLSSIVNGAFKPVTDLSLQRALATALEATLPAALSNASATQPGNTATDGSSQADLRSHCLNSHGQASAIRSIDWNDAIRSVSADNLANGDVRFNRIELPESSAQIPPPPLKEVPAERASVEGASGGVAVLQSFCRGEHERRSLDPTQGELILLRGAVDRSTGHGAWGPSSPIKKYGVTDQGSIKMTASQKVGLWSGVFGSAPRVGKPHSRFVPRLDVVAKALQKLALAQPDRGLFLKDGLPRFEFHECTRRDLNTMSTTLLALQKGVTLFQRFRMIVCAYFAKEELMGTLEACRHLSQLAYSTESFFDMCRSELTGVLDGAGYGVEQTVLDRKLHVDAVKAYLYHLLVLMMFLSVPLSARFDKEGSRKPCQRPSTLRQLVGQPMPDEFRDLQPPGVHGKCSGILKGLGAAREMPTDGFPVHPSWFREDVPLARAGLNYMWSIGMNELHWDGWHGAAERARDLGGDEGTSLTARDLRHVFVGLEQEDPEFWELMSFEVVLMSSTRSLLSNLIGQLTFQLDVVNWAQSKTAGAIATGFLALGSFALNLQCKDLR